MLHLATRLLNNGLKVRIDDERCHSTILVLGKFYFRLLGAWHREHMEIQYEVVSSPKLFVACVAFFSAKMSEAAEADLVLSFSFSEIAKTPRNF